MVKRSLSPMSNTPHGIPRTGWSTSGRLQWGTANTSLWAITGTSASTAVGMHLGSSTRILSLGSRFMSLVRVASASMSNSRSGIDMKIETPRPAARKPGMSRTQKLLFFLTAWLICLMPFLFWWNTWFGRKLSDQQLTEYLHDTKKPRHIQQALVQVGERITRKDAAAIRWYPQLLQLAADPVEEVRNTDAWVMGQDPSGAARLAAVRPHRRFRSSRYGHPPEWTDRKARICAWSNRRNPFSHRWTHPLRCRHWRKPGRRSTNRHHRARE